MDWATLQIVMLTATTAVSFAAFLVALGALRRTQATAHRRSEVLQWRGTVAQLKQELDELASQTHLRLDSKVQSLRELLDDAERVLNLLRAGVTFAALDESVVEGALPAVESRADLRCVASGPVGTEIRPDSAGNCHTGEMPAAAAVAKARRQPILTLAERGLTATEIAAQTNVHLGEVELMLKLNRQRLPRA
jgi:hypothetical protein